MAALQHEPAAVMLFANNILTYLLGDPYFSGNVVRADINLDSDHKSKGFGTVQFETATEAINAVCILSMNTVIDVNEYREAAWPSGQRVGLAIWQSWVRVLLWPLAGFVIGRPELKSLATLVNSQLVAFCQLGF